MKVIFIKDLKGQGKSGEVKEVKDGYGSNFLIKNGYAVMVTSTSLKRLDEENKEKASEEAHLIKEAQEHKEKIDKINIEFKVKTGEHDKVFGSISSKQIAGELKNKGFDVDKHKIHMAAALSALGTYNIKIELHKQVIANLTVVLVKEG